MNDRTTLKLHVVPGAKRDEIAGTHGESVKVRCQAPALEGRANEAVVTLLADRLGLRRGEVVLLRGERSRDKVVAVHGLSPEEVWARLGLAGAGR